MGELLTAFGVVSLAELGDKTQLVALGFGARHRLALVLLGITLAYLATNLVSVVVGGVLGAAFPTEVISVGGGVLFLLFALVTFRADDDEAEAGEVVDDVEARAAGRSIVLTVAGAMFVAELGDKTMLATATLAASGSPVLVWIGATVGIICAGAIGVLVGRVLGARLPTRVIRIGSAVLFAVFGVGLIVTGLA
jgi:putative Ca2+/H+ antiporter (TMEM165/GDT1 family)